MTQVAPIGSEPMLMFDAAVGPPHEVGLVAGLQRRFIPITGGSVTGRFQADILPGGDWQNIEPDGTLEIDAHYILKTKTGLVEVRSMGLRAGPPEVLAKLMRGEATPPSDYYFRTVMHFKTAVSELAWLNHRLAIAVGERLAQRVKLAVYEVL
jgi:Protein of unknown function (DUF3237)